MRSPILALFHATICLGAVIDNGIQARSGYQPIDLDPALEYSAEDLKVLFSAQKAKVDEAQSRIVPGIDNIQRDLASTPSAVSLDLKQTATFGFWAICDIYEKTTGTFIVEVRYDGHNVFYKSLQNIDSFGPYTSGGGGRQPVFSTARWHHTACRAIDDNTFCSYYYHSTIKATISYPNKGIEIGTFQPGEGGPDREAYVVETCVAMSKLPLGKKSPCPKPTGTRCTLNPISVRGGAQVESATR